MRFAENRADVIMYDGKRKDMRVGKSPYGEKWHILREDGVPICGYMSYNWKKATIAEVDTPPADFIDLIGGHIPAPGNAPDELLVHVHYRLPYLISLLIAEGRTRSKDVGVLAAHEFYWIEAEFPQHLVVDRFGSDHAD